MNYQLRAIIIRINNSSGSMTQIDNLWTGIINGRFDLDLPPNETIISRYSSCESDESSNYDPSVTAMKKDFIEQLGAEAKRERFRVCRGETDDGDVTAVAELAQQRVWNDTQFGELERAFTVDHKLSEVESGKTTYTVCITLP